MTRRLHHSHHGLHLHKKAPKAVPLPSSDTLERLVEKPIAGLNSLFRRQSSSSTDACSGSKASTPGCQKPTDSNSVTLPVALAVVIPLVLAIFVFVFLHRKHVKKLRQEDANDPHKSLDFGWDPTAAPSGKGGKRSKKNVPEMSITDLGEKGSRRERGLSMDLHLGSPYLLPPGVNGSRESLHSLSRTIHSEDDRYRPAVTYNPSDTRSLHSYHTGRKGADDASSDAGSASIRRGPRDDMRQDLLGNAQRMSRSMPPSDRSPVPEIQEPETVKGVPRKALPSSPQGAGLAPTFPLSDSRDSYMSDNGAALRKSNNYLGAFIHSREPSSDLLGQGSESATPNESLSTPLTNLQQTPNRKSPPPTLDMTKQNGRQSPPPANPSASMSSPPRIKSLRASEQGEHDYFLGDSVEYGDGFKVTPPSPHGSHPEQYEPSRQSSQEYMPPIDEYALGVDDGGLGYNINRLSMGVRPLPPDDPSDNPEQRANRIRSFYKEYFDDTKPGPVGAGEYYEDYDQQYLGDGAIWDDASGQYVTAQPQYEQHRGRPFAEPVGRRAMTPPPRAPPRFARQHAATMSSGSHMTGPRAFSSASGRFGPSGRGPPKKKLPPPSPLNVLPTPHMLKDDSFALFNSMDFAPPTSARERQAGRPESPRGGRIPYSPIVPAHVPLASSFVEIAAMPSP